MHPIRVAPSILAADFANLAAAVSQVAPATDILHVDVMDGHFVPNISIGPPVVQSLRAHTDMFLDCHLMISDPGEYLSAFKKAGADGCSVHVEVGSTAQLVEQMRDLGLAPGLAVNPDTPFEAVEPFLGDIELLLFMTVHPGFGGQSFIADVMPKVRAARAALDEHGWEATIQVDGGIDETTAPEASAAGADLFVAGTAVFARPDPAAAVRGIQRAAEAAR
ncbi:MAG TPA: ribulose-phosphate 3-epimerase [Acidimicrobiales bacterium]|nr:ribulose-phosphate 3-epimerase [Acidimicrobiales bacterium]